MFICFDCDTYFLNTKTIHIENIGTVIVTRRKGSSRISLRVKPDGIISVNHPWFATEKEVLSFIEKNADWIRKQHQLHVQRTHFFELNQPITTKFHSIQILPVEKGMLRAALKDGNAVITIPHTEEVRSERVQQFIRKVIVEICRKEAKTYLPPKVDVLARQFGFIYQKVFIKNLKSKWGSCSSVGNINLNLHLMVLPDHLIDYIILHELVHTRHLNHGPNFWLALNQVTNGMARQLDREMKSKSRLILK